MLGRVESLRRQSLPENSVMIARWFALCLIGLLWGQPARADTIVLRNGEHIEGQIVSETASDVSIRRAFKTGNITFTDKISRADIARIEHSATQPAAPEQAAPSRAATRPAAEPEASSAKIADKPAFLDGAIKKLQKPDYNAAGLDLSRLITACSPSELGQISTAVQGKLGMSLAEVAASTHFAAAMEKAKGRAVQFQYVTEYEKPALIPMIKDAYDKAIEVVVTVPGGDDEKGKEHARPAVQHDAKAGGGGEKLDERDGTDRARGSRRSMEMRRHARSGRQSIRGNREREDEGRKEGDKHEEGEKEPTSRPAMSIQAWLDRPEDFDGSRRESAAMSVQIYHARSLLSERRRLDPQLRTDLDLKAELAAEQNRLEALLKAVKARSGGALTPQEREALEAEHRNRIDAMQREEWRRRNATMLDLQRLIEQQQLQNQPVPGAGPPPAAPTPTPAPAPRPQ
jgi:hypothetical protein